MSYANITSSDDSSHHPTGLGPGSIRIRRLQRLIQVHCLVGRLASQTTMHTTTVRFLARQAWHIRSPAVVLPCAHNTFLFLFENLNDRGSIVNAQPWGFLGRHLCLSDWPGPRQHDTFNLHESYLWVQVECLPIRFHTRANIEKIAAVFPRFHGTAESYKCVNRGKGMLRIRVAVAIHQPLLAGVRVPLPSGEWVTLRFSYEGLSAHCYECGEWDHKDYECPNEVDDCV